MQRLLTTLLILLSSASVAQNHWQVINQSNTHRISIQFITPRIGWAASIWEPCTLYKSMDGGYTWPCAIEWNPNIFSSHIAFFNERRGFLGASEWAAVTFDGETWTQFRQPEGVNVEAAVYLDSTYLIGTSNIIMSDDTFRRQTCRSTDGGLTWESLYVEIGRRWFGELALSANGTLLMGDYTDGLWRSTDRGQSWLIIDNLPFYVDQVSAADSGVFFEASSSGFYNFPTIARSSDDGLTWQTVWTDSALPPQFFLYDIRFSDRLHGWVSGQHGFMLQTSDGGETWASYYLPDSGSQFGIASLSFVDSSQGWGVDPGGAGTTLVYHWTTATDVSSQRNRFTPPSDLRIISVCPNPFNPQATIRFDVPRADLVTVAVYDIVGRPLDVLLHSHLSAGIFQLNWEATHHASGTYFLQIRDGTQSVATKLLLVK